MHFIADSSEEDFNLEIFWKEKYKNIFKNEIGHIFKLKINKIAILKKPQNELHKNFFSYKELTENIKEIFIIYLENGSDEGFDMIYEAFRKKEIIPKIKKYAIKLWPDLFSDEIVKKIKKSIIDEYSKEISYREEYKEHYSNFYRTFEEFLNEVSNVIINLSFNAGEDGKIEIFKSIFNESFLPKARRKAKRLKGW